MIREGSGKQAKRVLEGIERINFDTYPCLCFVGSVMASMRFLGENVTKEYMMGISGGAFQTYWEIPWGAANCDLLLIGDEPVRRTFDALGYEYEVVPGGAQTNTKETLRKRIVDSIDDGHPVLAIGIVGPPECCVISGYSEGGDVLYGWSYYQGEEDTKTYFRTDKWYENCYGLILIGDKKPKPSKSEILLNTLVWAIKLAREPEFVLWGLPDIPANRRCKSGFAAFDAFADALLRDDDFPADKPDVLSFHCNMPIKNDVVFLMECKRTSAARFLNIMSQEGLPGSDELRKAAEAYTQEAQAWHKATVIVPGTGGIPYQRIVDSQLRRELSSLVREAKIHEERAVEHLDKALKELVGL